jgi:hypothetical protein
MVCQAFGQTQGCFFNRIAKADEQQFTQRLCTTSLHIELSKSLRADRIFGCVEQFIRAVVPDLHLK